MGVRQTKHGTEVFLTNLLRKRTSSTSMPASVQQGRADAGEARIDVTDTQSDVYHHDELADGDLIASVAVADARF